MNFGHDFTADERKAIDEVKANVKDLIPNSDGFDADFVYIRFLEAKKFNVEKASRNLKRHLRQRKAMSFDSVDSSTGWNELQEPAPAFTERWPSGTIDTPGVALGRFDNCMLAGAFFNEYYNYGDLRQNIRHSEMFLGLLIDSERSYRKVIAREKETGKRSGFIQIIDFEGIKIDVKSITPFIHITNFLEANYPGLMAKILFVNVNAVVRKFWEVSKRLSKLADRIDFLQLKNLSNYLRPDLTPKIWGGTFVDSYEDPYCREMFVIPQPKYDVYIEFDRKKDLKTLFGECGETLSIEKGKDRYLSFPVTAEQCPALLKWTFFASDGFSFGIYRTANDAETDPEKMDLIYPEFPYLLETLIPDIGHCICSQPGVYKVRFGNEDGNLIKKLKIDHKFNLVPNYK